MLARRDLDLDQVKARAFTGSRSRSRRGEHSLAGIAATVPGPSIHSWNCSRSIVGVRDGAHQRGSGLFPSPKEIRFSCSCPDSATMCKHIAATLYVSVRDSMQSRISCRLRKVDAKELIAQAARAKRCTEGATRSANSGFVEARRRVRHRFARSRPEVSREASLEASRQPSVRRKMPSSPRKARRRPQPHERTQAAGKVR